jgi:hypothetical protein
MIIIYEKNNIYFKINLKLFICYFYQIKNSKKIGYDVDK